MKPEISADVASIRPEIARRALALREWERLTRPEACAVLADAARHLAAADLVPKREQADRFRVLLTRFRQSELDTPVLVELAREMPAHLRAVIADTVPASVRPQIYGAMQRATSPWGGDETAASPPISNSKTSSATVAASESRYDEEAVVLLLSNRDCQVANVNALKQAGFAPMVVSTVEEIEEALLTERSVCACVIDQSFLQITNGAEQKHVLERLGTYSTFLRVRVQDIPESGALKLSREEVRIGLHRWGNLTPHVHETSTCFDQGRNIAPNELGDFRAARDILRSHSETRFVVGELSDTQAHLLVAAARKHVRAESTGAHGTASVTSLTTRFLSGGRSGAALATVRINDTGPTLVAKLAPTAEATLEMERFQRFIPAELRDRVAPKPELHVHRENAVILTALISTDSDRNQPAEPLDERICSLWNDEWLHGADAATLQARGRDLENALRRVAVRLRELNACRAPSAEIPNEPTILESVARLGGVGFDCGLGAAALAGRSCAVARFGRLARAAVVHGDIHLLNVLVRGESEVHIIDFAAVGPGHPAEDLVRFEMALFAGSVRQFEAEEESVAFQRALSIDRAGVDVLVERFPHFFRYEVNRACAHGMTAARDRAMEVLYEYGGEPADYIAAKYLVAWQFLGMPRVSTAMARAVVAALHGALVEDSANSPARTVGEIQAACDAEATKATAVAGAGSLHKLSDIAGAGRETAKTKS